MFLIDETWKRSSSRGRCKCLLLKKKNLSTKVNSCRHHRLLVNLRCACISMGWDVSWVIDGIEKCPYEDYTVRRGTLYKQFFHPSPCHPTSEEHFFDIINRSWDTLPHRDCTNTLNSVLCKKVRIVIYILYYSCDLCIFAIIVHANISISRRS